MNAVDGDNVKMTNKVIHESVHGTTSRLRSRIQLTQSEFKLIKFNNGKRGQAEKLIEEEDTIVYVADISSDKDNYLLLKNNLEYK